MEPEPLDRPVRARAAGLPPWAWAVLVSVAAHGLLIAGVVASRGVTPPPLPAPPSPTVVMRVGLHGPTGPAPSRAAPSASEGGAPYRPRVASPASSAGGDVVARVETPSPTGLEAATAQAEPMSGRGEALAASGDGEARGGGVHPAEEGAPPAAPGGAGDALDADVVGLVHARLAAGAERCYPAAARRYQQRGTAEVRFCVDANGQPQEGAVARSSGSTLLDAAVGDCVLPAASPFPASAQGRCFTVPVRFGAR